MTGPTATDDGGLQVELTHTFANPEEATALLQSINGSGGPLHGVVLRARSTRRRHDHHDERLAAHRRSCGVRRSRCARRDRSDAVRGGDRRHRPQGPKRRCACHDPRGTCPGRSPRRPARSRAAACRGSCRSTGRNSTSATTAVDDHGTAKIWGIASNVALIALVVWCVLAAAFIVWVVRQRKRRAAPQRRSSATPCNTPS